MGKTILHHGNKNMVSRSKKEVFLKRLSISIWAANLNNSSYFYCPDAERFYPFEILAFRTLKL